MIKMAFKSSFHRNSFKIISRRVTGTKVVKKNTEMMNTREEVKLNDEYL